MKTIIILLFTILSQAQVFERTYSGWILTKDSLEIREKVDKFLKSDFPRKKLYKEVIIKTDSTTIRISDSVIYIYERKKYYKVRL